MLDTTKRVCSPDLAERYNRLKKIEDFDKQIE
jgi:hypothetical protein